MVESASALRLHGTQRSSDLPSRERGVPVDVLEKDRFLPGLLEGSGKLIRSPVVLMFRPVSFPSIRPQGQRCARVGTISPLVVERDLDLGGLVGLPQESMGTRRALRERVVAPLFEVPTAYWASFWKTATSPMTLAGCRVPCVTC